MKRRIAIALMLVPLFCAFARADATVPTRDIAGAKDVASVKRYEGAFIVSYERKAFGELTLPLSPLEAMGGDKRDPMNNKIHAPKQKIELEGAITRLVYVLPQDRSPLEVLRNYETEAKAAGGEVLFTCKSDTCGGDASRAVSGGGGDQSLAMQFLYERDIKDAAFSNGSCALTSDIADQRYSAMRIPGEGGPTHVAVQTFELKNTLYCKALNGRTIAIVHVIEPKGREQKMVTVNAAEMGKALSSAGRIALYGVYFDTNKADVKAESAQTLTEIAKLLKDSPKLSVLIVGHTDNVGDFKYNIDLSRRRAEAVAALLTKQYGIAAQRMRPAGVGMVAPVTSNDEDAGRAKNRRVELVKLN